MEPVSLTIGVVSLAGLFNNALDSFHYVRLARNFGQDFQTSQLRLDGARLRLSRWGQSLGLNDDLISTQTLSQALGSSKDVTQAEAVLGQVLELFLNAERISAQFKERNKHSTSEMSLHDPSSDLQPTARTLHERIGAITSRRQRKTDLIAKTKWALYKGKDLDRLIEDITELMDVLDRTFPFAKEVRAKLCEEEVSVLNSGETHYLLREMACGQDKELEANLEKASERTGSQVNNTIFSGSNNHGSQVGVSYGVITSHFGGRSN